jgi:predicted polyphosphate/ATP-dependent NAD kinase
MGGSVGLKGTDGKDVLEEARRRGATPVAPERARMFACRVRKTPSFFTCDEPMGNQVLQDCGITATSLYSPSIPTTSQDTKIAAQRLLEKKLDILVFVGGDGTARDILEAIGQRMPVLGVPAGVKMYSGVFAFTPRHAADILNSLSDDLIVAEREVVDIDEGKFRTGELDVSVKGYLLAPEHDSLQCSKSFTTGGTAAKKAIAEYVVERMQKNVIYVIGGGTTTRALKDFLNIRGSLLGVDVIKNGKLLCKDATAADIRKVLGKQNVIIVSPLGGHGFVFGRGNEPITPEIIKQVGIDNIIIIATPQKAAELAALRMDTGDEELDNQFHGFLRVVTGHGESKLMRVA